MKLLQRLMLFAIVFFATALQVSAQKNDETAIKKVLEQETSSYFHKDYNGWADVWMHDTAASALRAGANGYSQLLGWNAVSATYRNGMQALRVRTDAEIAPFMKKTDYHIYINGNMATATFKEGDKNPNTEMRTLVKQNGAWKILNLTVITNSSYAMQDIMKTMNSLVGNWELDGKATAEPSNGVELSVVKFDLRQTSDGWEQLSTFVTTRDGQTNVSPTSYEYFIPDYRTNTIYYTVIEKNRSGQTFPGTGTITSEKPNSFTVTQMFSDKPTAVQSEYTVTLQNGKWHQTGKSFDRDGKQIWTSTMDLHRVVQ